MIVVLRRLVKRMDPRVQLIITLMKEELHQDLTLNGLAQTVNLSLPYLHHLFKAETGSTPGLYLHSLRLEKARELLVTTMLSVKQVMIRVGMKDKSHFGREFKKTYGQSPGQYRMAARLNHYLQKM